MISFKWCISYYIWCSIFGTSSNYILPLLLLLVLVLLQLMPLAYYICFSWMVRLLLVLELLGVAAVRCAKWLRPSNTKSSHVSYCMTNVIYTFDCIYAVIWMLLILQRDESTFHLHGNVKNFSMSLRPNTVCTAHFCWFHVEQKKVNISLALSLPHSFFSCHLSFLISEN